MPPPSGKGTGRVTEARNQSTAAEGKGSGPNQPTRETQPTVKQLDREIKELTRIYGQEHPKVQALRQIAAQQRESERTNKPVTKQLQSRLSAISNIETRLKG